MRRGSFAPPERTPPPQVRPDPPPPSYGIDNAIQLMRTLPMDDDPDLVLRVVRKTLRSTHVSVEQIVDSAKSRESTLSASVDEDRASIEQLEREIAARRANIERTEAQLTETRCVRERLEDAIENETKVGLLFAPAERARLQGLARAAMSSSSTAGANAEPAAAPTSQSSSVPESATLPVPKVGADNIHKKPFAPKLPAPMPRQATTSNAPPKRSAGAEPADPAAPRQDASVSVPRLSDDADELSEEPTAQWLGGAVDVASTRKR